MNQVYRTGVHGRATEKHHFPLYNTLPIESLKMIFFLVFRFILTYFILNRVNHETFSKTKFTAHIIYALAAIVSIDWNVRGYPMTHSLNPIANYAAIRQRDQQTLDLYDKMFGKNGIADTNKDGNIDFIERADDSPNPFDALMSRAMDAILEDRKFDEQTHYNMIAIFELFVTQHMNPKQIQKELEFGSAKEVADLDI